MTLKLTTKKKNKDIVVANPNLQIIEKIEAKFGVAPLNVNEDLAQTRVPSSSLAADLIIGGGIPSGRWITYYGAEQSGKSTGAYQMCNGLLLAGCPSMDFFDYESSLATEYFANIVGMPLDVVLGKKDRSDNWINIPKVRHYIPANGEEFFYTVASKLAMMPDVVLVQGERYLRYTEKQFKAYKIDKKHIAFTEDKKIYIRDFGCPVKYAIFIDSFPEMVPKANVEDPTKSPMAAQARMFADLIPTINSKLKPKGAVLIGVNHIRMRPMVMFGSPEYTPCGEHLKHATDIRFRVSSVSIPNGKGRIEEEVNLNGDLERFAYSKWVTKKNKTFPKEKEVVLRVCIEQKGKSGYGIDPVWDTLQYLKMTKQISKRGEGIKIQMEGPWEEAKKLTWTDLKLMTYRPWDDTLLSKFNHPAFRKVANMPLKKRKFFSQKILNLRGECQAQLLSGEAFDLATR